MSELRKHTGGFVHLPNEAVNDERLSFRARGLLVYMLGRPPGWRFAADRIARESPKEGRESVLAGLRELQDAGYYRSTRLRAGAGRFVTVTEVASHPSLMPALPTVVAVPEVPTSAEPTPVERPTAAQPESVQPESANPTPQSVQRASTESQESKSNPIRAERGRGKTEPEPLAAGQLPQDAPAEPVAPASLSTHALASYFQDKARVAAPMDARSAVTIEAMRGKIKALREKDEATGQEIKAMIDLFFTGTGNFRPGKPFWQSFVAIRSELLLKVRANVVVEGEDWKERRLRKLGITCEPKAPKTWAERKAARLAELGVTA